MTSLESRLTLTVTVTPSLSGSLGDYLLPHTATERWLIIGDSHGRLAGHTPGRSNVVHDILIRNQMKCNSGTN